MTDSKQPEDQSFAEHVRRQTLDEISGWVWDTQRRVDRASHAAKRWLAGALIVAVVCSVGIVGLAGFEMHLARNLTVDAKQSFDRASAELEQRLRGDFNGANVQSAKSQAECNTSMTAQLDAEKSLFEKLHQDLDVDSKRAGNADTQIKEILTRLKALEDRVQSNEKILRDQVANRENSEKAESAGSLGKSAQGSKPAVMPSGGSSGRQK